MENHDSLDWVSIRTTAYSNIELAIVIGRLETAGIEARVLESVIGGWLGRDTAKFVQVRKKDFETARELLNEA
jgi:hypothetical protein